MVRRRVSAVSNHEGPAAAARPSSFETRAKGALLRMRGWTRLARSAERQIDPLPAEQRVLAVGQRRDAVIGEPRGAAPDHDIAVHEPEAARLVAARHAAEQEDRR